MMSPFTGGKVKDVCTIEEKEFRKEKFNVHVRYYVCEDTGEQFTITEQDTLQFNDLYSQYRVRHGILFPDEIKNIRTGYGLNYSQISRILGFGVNQYAKYESGEVPSESNGKMIAAIKDRDVLIGLLKSCRSVFQPSEYDRILTSILRSESEDTNSALHKIIYSNDDRSIFNGYGSKSIPKLFDLVSYIVSEVGEVFPTKLNKLMFYVDFSHFRKSGESISGLQYEALNFGPVPNHYATIYDNVAALDKRIVEAHGMVGSLLSCSGTDFGKLLSSAEIDTVDNVVSVLRNLSVSEIIAASHKENCWLKYSSAHTFIPYDEAFDLKLI